jgi:hypothetical protein
MTEAVRIRRIRLVLPARMKGTAVHDARVIAEAAGKALAGAPGEAPGRVEVPGRGLTGAVLAGQVGLAVGAGGRHGR